MTPRVSNAFALPFAEQQAFFRRKLRLPTERWDDIHLSAHDRAFIVAGAKKADLLYDLHQSLADTYAKGGTLKTWRKDFKEIVARHGWTGWTGEGTAPGVAWRTRIIYETNLRTSRAAGRWIQLTDPDVLKAMPYWRYVHNDSVLHPRVHHKAWGDARLTLPANHPFWRTHYPPNGWGCECYVTAVAAPLPGDLTLPPQGWDVPNAQGALPGIDPGWAYAPGADVDTALREMVQDKLITYPEAISKALSRDINRHIDATRDPAQYVRDILAAGTAEATPSLWLGFAEGVIAERDLRAHMILIPADAPLHIERRHGRDGGGQRPPQPADYAYLQQIINTPDAIETDRQTGQGLDGIVTTKIINGETYRVVWERRAKRVLALKTLIIKTGKEK